MITIDKAPLQRLRPLSLGRERIWAHPIHWEFYFLFLQGQPTKWYLLSAHGKGCSCVPEMIILLQAWKQKKEIQKGGEHALLKKNPHTPKIYASKNHGFLFQDLKGRTNARNNREQLGNYNINMYFVVFAKTCILSYTSRWLL